VTLKRGDAERTLSWTPEAPVLAAAPGAYLVQATADGLRSQAELVWVRPGAASPRVTLVVESGPSIRGHVIAPSGLDAEFGVYILRFDGQEPSDKTLRVKGKGRSAGPANDYRFAFAPLEPGTYAVGAAYRVGSRPLDARATVTVEGGAEDVELRVVDLPGPVGSAVRVLGPSGVPCVDAELHAGSMVGKAVDLGYAPVARRSDGFWLLQPLSESTRRAGGREILRIRSPALGETYAELVPGGDVRLLEPGWLELLAVPHDGIQLHSTLDMDALDQWLRVASCDGMTTDGRQGFGPLQPGTYRLVVATSAAGNEASFWPIETREIRVRAGVREAVTLAVPRPEYTLRVQAPSGRDTWKIELTRKVANFRGRETRTVAAGAVAEFAGLPAGTYVLEAPEASAHRVVEVPTDREVHFP